MAELALVPLLTSIGVPAATAATIGTAVGYAGTAMTVLGGISDYQAAKAESKAATVQANYEAKVAEQQAGQERAVSQRQALEEKKQAQLASSRVRAVAGSSDPTVANLITGIEATGDYNYLSALASGEEKARGLETGADLSRFEGRLKKQEANRRATKTLISTGASLFEKYGTGDMKDPSGTAFGSKTGGKFKGGWGYYGPSAGRIDWYK